MAPIHHWTLPHGPVLLLLLLLVPSTTPTSTPYRPHILMIVADDYGYNDVGYHQNAESP